MYNKRGRRYRLIAGMFGTAARDVDPAALTARLQASVEKALPINSGRRFG